MLTLRRVRRRPAVRRWSSETNEGPGGARRYSGSIRRRSEVFGKHPEALGRFRSFWRRQALGHATATATPSRSRGSEHLASWEGVPAAAVPLPRGLRGHQGRLLTVPSFPEQLPGSWTWKAGQTPTRSSPHAPPAFPGPWTRELTAQRTRRWPVVPAHGSTTDLLSPFLGVRDPAKTGRGFCLEVSRGCTRAPAGTVAHAQAPPGRSRLTRGRWQDSVPQFLMSY
ncbi:uncharacterized protein LOC122676834 [Cervus elaphus]|uniref:uncharacterized protein LOC122676834 n=1 Tax=Cervus elaphus TaxID=9860 RepID=UPI001CC2CE31|nr:uncharacterized protein LOC122676834 [Cervus elaphus]